jgi:hypothetical protein
VATFVHLTPDRHRRAIQRAGLAAHLTRLPGVRGVYAMPVTPDFVRTHQWLRELKRDGQRTVVGVYFSIPDDAAVWVGPYRGPHRQVTAAEAIGIFMDPATPLGFETVVPRGIAPSEIRRIRQLPQTVGWRYFPSAHGHRPCPCPACLRPGEIKSQRIRRRAEDA